MKRFAFITPAFTDSTIPLIRQFLQHGHVVDLFFLSKKHFDIYPAFNVITQINAQLISEVSKSVYSELGEYFGENFTSYAVKLNRPYKKVPLIGNICSAYRNILINKLCSFINHNNYDGTYIFSLYDSEDTYQLCKKIHGNVIVGLHEVCNHSNPNFKNAPRLISYLSSNKIPIVVYSSKSRNDLSKYDVVCPDNVYETRFGIYETYPYFKGKSDLQIKDDYLLFVGNIKPYKGIDLFIKAALDVLKELPNSKFIIAGNGYDSSLDLIKDNSNFILINRFISNEELVDLIAGCKAVVCPYKTASQSGVIPSAYAFNVPVIASDIDSFQEYIINNRTGILCDIQRPEELSEAMIKILSDEKFVLSLKDNIARLDELLPRYSWNYIYDEYSFFRK